MTREHHTVVDGVRIRYVDEGSTGRPVPIETLVIVPGHTARIEGFAPMLPMLTADHRVLVLDLPGSGYSDKPDREYTLRYYEDTIVAFLDQLQIEQAIPVGGSLGGNLVLRLGHRFPDRFPRLVSWAPGGAWKKRPRLGRLVGRCGRRLFWPVVRLQSRYWYSKDYPGRAEALRDTFDYYRDVMGPGFIRMYWGIAGDQIAHSLFDIGRDIGQPTLLIVGEDDNGANMRAGVTKLSTMIPDCEFHLFPDARHSLETEETELLAMTINAFLGSGAAPDGAAG